VLCRRSTRSSMTWRIRWATDAPSANRCGCSSRRIWQSWGASQSQQRSRPMGSCMRASPRCRRRSLEYLSRPNVHPGTSNRTHMKIEHG
jgi:hypothetical protein